MCTMCHVCGSELTNLGSACCDRICGRPFCQQCEKEVTLVLDGECSIWFCKSCLEKYDQESSRQDNSSPFVTPLISPTLSLTSFESCASSFGELSVDMDSQIREDFDEGALDTGPENSNSEIFRHSEDQLNGTLLKNTDIQSSDFKDRLKDLSITLPTEELDRIDLITVDNLDDNEVEKLTFLNDSSKEVESVKAGDDSKGTENAIDATSPLSPSLKEGMENTDGLLWMPPEAEDIEDDMECSVANNDDDDEYSDGTKWGQSTSLCCIDENQGSSNRFKDERQKAMEEVMNGHFRSLVSRLLALEDIALSEESIANWLNIVSSLSWEAASLVKPDAIEGKEMHPGCYVKVKCIASGARSESQLFKGLVFTKNAAHKHMPTSYKNPRLLLLEGMLGHRSSALSSFDRMEQENDYVKSIIEMIELSHPNVVLVEKTVSRDVQESLLAKGITLVFDMKLPRLERIGWCTGSQIVSSADSLMNPKLKHCDSFRVEKFVKDYSSYDKGGKRSSKTLMFFEGCPKPLGCTVLLKGASNDELKKVKCVVQHAVFVAYHLILETSFLVDQRAVFSKIHTVGVQNDMLTNKTTVLNSNVPTIEGCSTEIASSLTRDIAIPNGFLDLVDEGMCCNYEGNSTLYRFGPNSYVNDIKQPEKFNNSGVDQPETIQETLSTPIVTGQLLSSLSASPKKVLGDGFPRVSPASYPSMSTYFDIKEKEPDNSTAVWPIPPSLETVNCEMVAKHRSDQDNCHGGSGGGENTESMPAFCEASLGNCKTEANNGVQVLHMDDIKTILGPQSILVLMSSQCILNRTVCKLSHLSRIKYYGNSDMSLGRFLRENLLNQEHHCSECGEPPKAHAYCYTNQNGKLTVIVKQLPPDRVLSGEAEGKIWMWNLCLKCKPENGIPKQSQRVVMSSAARALSFGKFLELSFSNHSTSSCGHSLQRDLLHFYGFGSTVAIFRCSSIDIYAACMPPPFLEFDSPNGQEWLKKEANDVLEKGNILFREVTNSLQKIGSRISGSLSKGSINHTRSMKEISEIEEMLRQEKSDFEASLQKTFCKNGQSRQTVNEILGLNRLNQELLLELYVWDHRLHSLLLSSSELHQTGNLVESNENVVKAQDSQPLPEDMVLTYGQASSGVHNFVDIDSAERRRVGSSMGANSGGPSSNKRFTSTVFGQNSSPILYDPSAPIPLGSRNSQEEYLPISDHAQVDYTIPTTSELLRHNKSATDLDLKIGETVSSLTLDNMSHKSSFKDPHLHLSMSQKSQSSNSEDPGGWIWTPFSETCEEYRRDINRSYSQKFESINSYIPAHLSSVIQLITQDGSRLHFPVGTTDDVVSVYEDELTSIIACALALLQEKEMVKDREGSVGKEIESPYSLASTYWSSSDSLDPEGIRLRQSASSDELSTSGSEGFSPLDPSLSSDVLHPEIPIGVGRFTGKGKYSVVSIHAKQFYALRKKCCPSELSYISSLSRCKKWDAQGGKSNALFEKTLDDRFIIKQVKKTELDSFLKFAPYYFKHMSYSLSSGSQTCLAKILGIYQVIVRQTKNGKELKIDLMVMENLLFSRNVSHLYDLKGALHSRYTSDENGTGKVLLDQNFVKDMLMCPLYISGKAKHLLQRAIWNDTSFLTSINVMDYSLLVGVDKQRRELVFGIIDYLRQYTWDKHLETWVKASLVVPKNALPTVISPKEYKKRFRKFMSTYFLTVPDHTCSDGFSGP